ncbi:hypothetical protein cyc_00813 [Cyclospora cayetanensis]|uniref:Uncharacterized protein n=1 Tax=Cyclospora cayetanensis TaxID=88456 RepID=A0A1D3CRS0_9EIME|nr:hypothetical protein cyc_00813 [Cyclospora cayetanensis]
MKNHERQRAPLQQLQQRLRLLQRLKHDLLFQPLRNIGCQQQVDLALHLVQRQLLLQGFAASETLTSLATATALPGAPDSFKQAANKGRESSTQDSAGRVVAPSEASRIAKQHAASYLAAVASALLPAVSGAAAEASAAAGTPPAEGLWGDAASFTELQAENQVEPAVQQLSALAIMSWGARQLQEQKLQLQHVQQLVMLLYQQPPTRQMLLEKVYAKLLAAASREIREEQSLLHYQIAAVERERCRLTSLVKRQPAPRHTPVKGLEQESSPQHPPQETVLEKKNHVSSDKTARQQGCRTTRKLHQKQHLPAKKCRRRVAPYSHRTMPELAAATPAAVTEAEAPPQDWCRRSSRLQGRSETVESLGRSESKATEKKKGNGNNSSSSSDSSDDDEENRYPQQQQRRQGCQRLQSQQRKKLHPHNRGHRDAPLVATAAAAVVANADDGIEEPLEDVAPHEQQMQQLVALLRQWSHRAADLTPPSADDSAAVVGRLASLRDCAVCGVLPWHFRNLRSLV